MTKIYNKYLVIKRADIDNYLNYEEIHKLYDLVDIIDNQRNKFNKSRNQYFVINQDEPYANIVHELIELFN